MPDERWQQQIHKDCGGEIVIVVQRENRKMAACCKKCRHLYLIPAELSVWPDWERPDSLHTSGGLVLPQVRGIF